MSRYINIDDISLRKTISVGGLSAKALWRRIQQEPSIDIVRCKECKHCTLNVIIERRVSGYERCVNICKKHSVDMYVPIDHYCGYGERREP